MKVCARVNGDIAIVQVSDCHERLAVPCVSVRVPLTGSYPTLFYAFHAHGCETADTSGLRISDGVPCLYLNLGSLGFQPVHNVPAHLCQGDIVEDSELVEPMDGSEEEAIQVCPIAVVVCL